MNADLPAIRIAQPTEVDGYMIVARELLQGVEALAAMPHVPPRAAAFLAGQALECALKAYLCFKGKRTQIRSPAVRHDLIALWEMACGEGLLGIHLPPPEWCVVLSSGHGPNFYLRYQEGVAGTIVHGGQTPALVPLAAELRKVLDSVAVAVKA